MRILVIGGSGFIGRFVCNFPVREGHAVTVVHRGRNNLGALVPGAKSLINSQPLPSRIALEASLAAAPERVVHMLAMTQADARAAAEAFTGKIGRLVFASSGDAYRAYGRFIRSERGPIEPMPLLADSSPLREKLYPYRSTDSPQNSLAIRTGRAASARA